MINKITKYIYCIPLAVLAIISAFPLLYIITNAFMGAEEFSRYYGGLSQELTNSNPLHFIPEWITLEGFKEILYLTPHYLMRFWVSLFLGGSILAGQMIIAVLGGYAFARFKFPFRDTIFFIIVLLMMMPLQVTIVPNYIVIDSLGLVGSYWAVILPGIFSAFGVFLMRQVMLGLPIEIFEAAKIDGAGHFKRLLYICLPNCKSGLAALTVLSFADSLQMVEQPIVFLKDVLKYPMSVFLTRINEMHPEVIFAFGLLSVLPVLILFLRFRDDMVQGIEYTTIK